MKLDSLKNTAEFSFVYKNSFKSFHRHFALYAFKLPPTSSNPLLKTLIFRAQNAQNLLGLSVSKKIGKANKRNLIKRRIRAIFQAANFRRLCVIFVAKEGILEMDFQTLKKDIDFHIKRFEAKQKEPRQHA